MVCYKTQESRTLGSNAIGSATRYGRTLQPKLSNGAVRIPMLGRFRDLVVAIASAHILPFSVDGGFHGCIAMYVFLNTLNSMTALRFRVMSLTLSLHEVLLHRWKD